MDENILFCFVFASQVLLISWFYPRRIISRWKYVLHNFPPSTHPKLYPYPPGYFERWLRNLARLNLVITGAGLLIIVWLVLRTLGGEGDDIIGPLWLANGKWAVGVVTSFFLLQFIAGVGYANFSSGKLLLAMAKAPPPRVRTTELRRRQLVDFVSPNMLVVAALTNAAFVGFVLYDYHRFKLPWFKVTGSIASVAITLLVFSVSVGIALRAPRLDPYQAHQDRRNAIKLVAQQALAFCIAYPVLLAVWLALEIFDPQILRPVIASVFCQGIALALLWSSYRYRVEEVDFTVYRQDARL